MSSGSEPRIPSVSGAPAWEVARLMPNQGFWTESDFLSLHTNRMAELVNGRLEVLPLPTWLHQLIVGFLVESIQAHLRAHRLGGAVLFAPLPTRLFPGTIREPDVLYVAPENLPKDVRGYPERLDFVIEVVSSGDDAHRRDYEDKRQDYARARIAEYWIVDPENHLITVLGLSGGSTYDVLGSHGEGDTAKSHYFPGFTVDVTTVFALGTVR